MFVPGMSPAVTHATTPGEHNAAEGSTDTTRANARLERTPAGRVVMVVVVVGVGVGNGAGGQVGGLMIV